MVESYWLIGQQIVEHEQHGEARADYGKGLLKELAVKLTTDFGKGFDESNLRYMRLFYRCFPIRDTLRHELTWSHYRRLISVEDEKARLWLYFYERLDFTLTYSHYPLQSLMYRAFETREGLLMSLTSPSLLGSHWLLRKKLENVFLS